MDEEHLKELEKLFSRSYVKGVRRHIEIPSKSVYSTLSETCSKHGERNAISFYGRGISYKELKVRVNAAAAYLSDLGIAKGDRVNIMLPNVPYFIIMFYALMKLGAVVVQTNPLYSGPEVKSEMEDSGSKTIITMADFAVKLKALYPETLDKIIVVKVSDLLPGLLSALYKIGENKKIRELGRGPYILYYAHSDTAREIEEPEFDTEKHHAVFQYTGGTTGIPKAAVLTHRNLIANIYQVTEWLPDRFSQPISYLCAIPYFHVYGMMTAMLLPVSNGSEMLLVPDPRNLKLVLKTIHKMKPTIFPGIPAMYHSVINHPKVGKYDIGSIELCISGAAPLPAEIQEKFENKTGAIILEGYGLSEASPVTNSSPADPEDLGSRRKQGSIGLPYPNTEERIVDQETGETDVPLGEVGELIIRGPQVMPYYWNNEKETAIALRNGWLYTGDLAKMDEDGYIYIVDRKKDMIIASGYNIYPREVEEVLYKHPDISEAAVVGVNDPHRGQTVKAFIVPENGKTLDEKEIKNYCSEFLAKYKIPRIIEFTDELPKTLVGKVLRRELRDKEDKDRPESD